MKVLELKFRYLVTAYLLVLAVLWRAYLLLARSIGQ